MTACVLTISDKGSRGERQDTSGPEAAAMLEAIGAEVLCMEIIPDDEDLIVERLLRHSGRVDIIITSGGTGLSPSDVTPEATLRVLHRRIPGMAEAMRAAGLPATPRAMLTRAETGIRDGTLIINLPGSPKGVRECLGAIIEVIPHAVEKARGGTADCAAPEGA